MQGRTDSLFPLGQADATYRALRKNGAPVSVDWVAGGHDGGDRETGRLADRTKAWFDRYLKDSSALPPHPSAHRSVRPPTNPPARRNSTP
ncbi:hypothetical protein A6A06_37950 [Streptomyces sp. CB02923]|nr:hypothetical protein A6A06_37950 [Streptomyces sp. CB02923]